MGKSFAKEKLKGLPKEKWNEKNKVHCLLHNQMAVGIIPPDVDAATAWTLNEEHNKMPWAKCKSRFNGMQSIVDEKLARAKSDECDLEHDLALYARLTHNAKGEPDWNLHEAPDLLEIDVDNESHKKCRKSCGKDGCSVKTSHWRRTENTFIKRSKLKNGGVSGLTEKSSVPSSNHRTTIQINWFNHCGPSVVATMPTLLSSSIER